MSKTLMATPAIEQAIRSVQNGQVDQYKVVIVAYAERLRGALAGARAGGIDVDELAHLVFVEAFRSISRYTPGTDFFAWMIGIARNLRRDQHKRRGQEARKQQRYLQHLLASTAGENDDVPLDQRPLAALRICTASLTDDSRTVLGMRYAEEKPLEQIANRLGKSVSAIKFQLHAIRKKLRSCIKQRLALGDV